MVLDTKKIIAQEGRLPVLNRTAIYLFGSLKLVDQLLFVRLMTINTSIVGVFLDDENFSLKEQYKDKAIIFVAIDTSICTNIITPHLHYIKKSPYFHMEYTYYPNPNITIFVIGVDPEIYKSFLLGKYSQMYTEEMLSKDIFYIKSSAVSNIINRTLESKKNFCKLLKITFDVDFTIEDLKQDVECELPPIYSPSSRYLETITYG